MGTLTFSWVNLFLICAYERNEIWTWTSLGCGSEMCSLRWRIRKSTFPRSSRKEIAFCIKTLKELWKYWQQIFHYWYTYNHALQIPSVYIAPLTVIMFWNTAVLHVCYISTQSMLQWGVCIPVRYQPEWWWVAVVYSCNYTIFVLSPKYAIVCVHNVCEHSLRVMCGWRIERSIVSYPGSALWTAVKRRSLVLFDWNEV